ncbi:MAG: hypothetical protein R2818_10375 [Flavobacteriales bacterium]
MEKLRTLLFSTLLITLVLTAFSVGPTDPTTYEAIVVMHITDLDDVAMSALAKSIGTEKNVTLEYSCVWSGLVVLKFSNARVAERADVITLARRQLINAGIQQQVEFLHVHAEERGPGKC